MEGAELWGEEVSRAVGQPVQQLQEQLPREAVLNADETGWRTNGDKRWIWALVAQRGFVRSFQRSAFSDQLPICDKLAGWASWMFFSEPEVPEVQRLSADG